MGLDKSVRWHAALQPLGRALHARLAQGTPGADVYQFHGCWLAVLRWIAFPGVAGVGRQHLCGIANANTDCPPMFSTIPIQLLWWQRRWLSVCIFVKYI